MKLLALILLLSISAPCRGADVKEKLDLDTVLVRIQNAYKEPLETREATALDLVKTHDSPTDRGKIYTTLALMYSSHGWHGPAEGKKSAQYCAEALKYPIGPATEAKLRVYWGEDLILSNRGLRLNAQELKANRQEVVKIFLQGLKVVLDNVTEKERLPLPGVNPYVCIGNCEELEARHQQQWVERRRVELQNDLVFYRDILNRKLVDVYYPYEDGTDELKNLARSVLTDAHKDAADELVENIAAAKKAKERRAEEQKKRNEIVFTEASTSTVRHTKKATKVRDAK